VDVNVHPGKTEVKFASEQDVYEACYWAVKNALTSVAAPREVGVFKNKEAYKMPITIKSAEQISFTKPKAEVKKSAFTPYTPSKDAPKSAPSPLTKNQIREEVKAFDGKLPVREIEGIKNIKAEEKKEIPTPPKDEKKDFSAEIQEAVLKAQAEKKPEASLDVRIIGQLFDTYILAEGDGEFFLMDQHAAHERIRYEKMRRDGYKTDTQLLLMPITVNLTPSEKTTALEMSDLLLSMGFQVEDFGKGSVVLRSLPADCPFDEGEGLFVELLGVIAGGEPGQISAMLDKATYTIACKSAIKAHQKLSVPELEKLFAEASALEGITTCPHGRPITVKLTRYQIEKMFGRII